MHLCARFSFAFTSAVVLVFAFAFICTRIVVICHSLLLSLVHSPDGEGHARAMHVHAFLQKIHAQCLCIVFVDAASLHILDHQR